MYFYKKSHEICLDFRGDLILTHNKELVMARYKGAAPRHINNVQSCSDIPNLSTGKKLKLCWAAFMFIFATDKSLDIRALHTELKEQNEAERGERPKIIV